jgi:hypothetical protein
VTRSPGVGGLVHGRRKQKGDHAQNKFTDESGANVQLDHFRKITV